MTTVKTFLVTASCGLMLLGAVAAPALELSSVSVQGKPNCFASPEGRDIPYAVGVPCPPPRDEDDEAALAA